MRRIDIINFVETLQNPQKHLRTLKDIKLITDKSGVPIMFSGGRSVVFKALHTDRVVALKCYENTAEQFINGLIESVQYFRTLNSPLTNQSTIYPEELVIHDELTNQTSSLTIELYDWIDGSTIGSELYEAAYLNDQTRLDFIVNGFLQIALELLDSQFAHGDLKADNIIIKSSGNFILIDLNNAYIPTFHYSPSREIGTNGFRHPQRNSTYYNKRIDDYPIVVMIATILVAQKSPQLFFNLYDGEFSIFSPQEIIHGKSAAYKDVYKLFENDILLLQIINLLQSKTPSIADLKWWIEKIIQLRQSRTNDGVEIYFDPINNKHGITDAENNITYPPIFSDANPAYSGIVSVKLNGTWCFISLNGKKLTEFKFEDVRKFSEDRVAVKISGKYGFLDVSLNPITDFIYDDVNNFSGGHAVVKLDDKYGYIDLTGNRSSQMIFDFAHNIKNSEAKTRIGTATTLLKF